MALRLFSMYIIHVYNSSQWCDRLSTTLRGKSVKFALNCVRGELVLILEFRAVIPKRYFAWLSSHSAVSRCFDTLLPLSPADSTPNRFVERKFLSWMGLVNGTFSVSENYVFALDVARQWELFRD